jgi:hypothetical protein
MLEILFSFQRRKTEILHLKGRIGDMELIIVKKWRWFQRIV